MTPAQFERARQIFHGALDIDSGERGPYLARECGDDAALRTEVESLLGARKRAASFLEPTNTDPAESAPLVGKTVGQYEVVGIIAEGGMGTVYEAVQRQPRRRVALKVLRAGVLGRGALSRFRHEAQVLGRLAHPGIAQVHEAGTHQDGASQIAYFTMELVEGSASITAYAAARGLTLSERLALFLKVCGAVAYAHQRGVIHRDLKPSNIMVDAGGNPKVLDFGLAKLTDADIAVSTMRTEAGQLLGTVPYMSPEQIAGDLGEVDTRSDVYALGVILYELLSGRLPHEGARKSLPEALRTIREDDPAPLGSVDRALRGDPETIVAKALEKDKSRRYQSVSALADDVARVLKHEPISARPVSAMYTIRKFARRNRALVGGTLLAALALVVGLGIATWQAVVATRARDNLAEQRRVAEIREYVACIAGADSALKAGDIAEAAARLDAAPRAVRNWEWWQLHRSLDDSWKTLTFGAAKIKSLAASADGRVLLGADGRRVHLYSVEDWSRSRLLPGPEEPDSISAAAWCPDGSGIVLGHLNGGITVRPVDNGTGLDNGPARTALPGEVVALCPLPLGTSLVARGLDGRVWRVTPGSGTADRLLEGASGGPAVTPDGSCVVLGVGPDVVLCEIGGGRVIARLHGHGGAVRCVAVSADGRRIFSGSDDATVRVWESATGTAGSDWQVRPPLSGHSASVTCIAPGVDATIISGSADGTVRVWDPADAREIAVLRGHRESVRGLAVLAGGIVASIGDRSVKLWRPRELYPRTAEASLLGFVAADQPPTASTVPLLRVGESSSLICFAPEDQNRAVAVAPDGRSIAAEGPGHDLVIIDTLSGRTERTLAQNVGGVRSAGFSKDGRLLASRCGDGFCQIWDVQRGVETARFNEPGAAWQAPAIDGAGDLVAADSTDGTVVLRKLPGAAVQARLVGHGSQVLAIVFSPDGSLLATSSQDSAVRLWDVRRARQVHLLRGHTGPVEGLAFSPDGTRLASGGQDGTVRLWDTRWGNQVAVLHASRFVQRLRFTPDGSVLGALLAQGPQGTQPSVSLWYSESDAERLVAGLLEECIVPNAVIARLEADPGLAPGLRERALGIARARTVDQQLLNDRAWAVVSARDRGADEYLHALRLAEGACSIDPENGFFLNTLGAAQYRTGKYNEALNTLTRSDLSNGGIPPDLAFLVMVRARLGQRPEAVRTLERLRATMGDGGWVGGIPAALADEAEREFNAVFGPG